MLTLEEIALKQSTLPKLSHKEQLLKVSEVGYNIRYIHNPSEAVCLEAVKQDGYNIQYIRKDLSKYLLKKKLDKIINHA